MNYNLISSLTNNLSKKQIKTICQLKETQWSYGIESQLKWFKKNNKKKDIHNMLLINSKLVGYTSLRLRSCIVKKRIKKNYLLFDTLVLNKKFRGKKFSKFIMNLNCDVINQSGFFSFLICNKPLIKFYESFGWKLIDKRNLNMIDHPTSKYAMTFNNKLSKNTKYIFFVKK